LLAAGRRLISCLDAQIPPELVLPALEQALTLRQPAHGLIIHADRGNHYISLVYQTRTGKAQALASYNRQDNPCAY